MFRLLLRLQLVEKQKGKVASLALKFLNYDTIIGSI